MLLLHGLGGGPGVWDKLVARAPAHLEVWDATLPWSGVTGPDWAREPDQGRWVREALDAVDAAAPAGDVGAPTVDLLVAHSFAATVTLTTLLDPGTAARVRRVALIAPFYRARAAQFDWETISYYLNDFHRILAEGIRVRVARTDPGIQAEMALRVRDLLGPHGWTRFFDTYLRTPDLTTDRVTTPVLVVVGEADFAAQPADGVELAAGLPFAHLQVLAGCGHFAMVERPEALARLLAGFIDPVLPTALPVQVPQPRLERRA
jgi:pimeloyl-ACP methyl ester carboxylesterase